MTKTATKSKALTLRPHEARRLRDAGRVLIVRECVNPTGSRVDIQDAEWVEQYANALGPRPCWSFKREMFRDHPAYGRRLACNSIAIDTIRCPFGPVGSPLWGRERYHDRGDYSTLGKHAANRYVYPATDGLKGGWLLHQAVTMPHAASRFPCLRLAACEVKRAGEATWCDVAAMGLPDEPRQVVKPGSVPIECIEIEPADMLARLAKLPADRWCWFATIEDAGRADA